MRRIVVLFLVALALVGLVGAGFAVYRLNIERTALIAENLMQQGWKQTGEHPSGTEALTAVTASIVQFRNVSKEDAIKVVRESDLARAYDADVLTEWADLDGLAGSGTILYTNPAGEVVLAYVYIGTRVNRWGTAATAFFGTLNTDLSRLVAILDGLRSRLTSSEAGQEVSPNIAHVGAAHGFIGSVGGLD